MILSRHVTSYLETLTIATVVPIYTPSAVDTSCFDWLMSFNVLAASSRAGRIHKALQVSRTIERLATPIPLAGGFISAGFSAATIVLESQMKRHNDHQKFLDLSQCLQSNVYCLYDSGVLTVDANGATKMNNVLSQKLRSRVARLARCVEEFKSLAFSLKASRRTKLLAGSQSQAQAILSRLSDDLKHYQREVLTDLATENVTLLSAQDQSPKYIPLQMIGPGVFFCVVGK